MPTPHSPKTTPKSPGKSPRMGSKSPHKSPGKSPGNTKRLPARTDGDNIIVKTADGEEVTLAKELLVEQLKKLPIRTTDGSSGASQGEESASMKSEGSISLLGETSRRLTGVKVQRRQSLGNSTNNSSHTNNGEGADNSQRSESKSARSHRSSSSGESGEKLGYLKRRTPGRVTSGYMLDQLYHNASGSDEELDESNRSLVRNESSSLTEEEGSIKMVRRGSMSRTDSSKLDEAAQSGMNLQELKDSLQTKKKNLKPKPGRIERRSSITSVNSNYTASSAYSGMVQESLNGSAYGDQSDFSMDMNELETMETVLHGGKASRRDSTVTMTSEANGLIGDTMPVNNVVPGEAQDGAKRKKMDQLVESLVWFSFHTPRAVLEDLISHEIDIWRKEQAKDGSNSKKSSAVAKKKKMKLTSKGLKQAEDDEDDGSLSSLSDEGGNGGENYDTNFSEKMMRMQRHNFSEDPMIHLPKAVGRESALLFVDMSGFTKLSTLLDVESLSKVINSYFDMIVSEVLKYGGDVLKFAGDAFFAEWKVPRGQETESKSKKSPLSELNASLASMMNPHDSFSDNEDWDDDDAIPALAMCVARASKCAMSIVEKYSDYQVTSMSGNATDAMLNVHCGVGVGHLIGLHVGDYKEDQEEDGMELRREFLILGEPIDQVARAEATASAGQVMVSPEAMQNLALCCDMLFTPNAAPVCIANKQQSFLNFERKVQALLQVDNDISNMQPYESLRMHCRSLNQTALSRLHLQTALYVHPVIRSDELALSAAIQAGKIAQPTETVEGRHRAEAELRSVFTIFINAIMTPKVTGISEIDQELYQKLADVMHVTSRELDRYSGHLRQFIVDDKGVVLIATFGLRGSTFPNMISNNGLPAVFAIHRALKTEVGVENRIGATFGKVYCGVVGGIHRHEFAVMGAPVNLAARLMASKVNEGILVDEAVRAQSDGRFEFKSLPPVKAKGYDKPVPILQPSDDVKVKKAKKSTFPFTGRKEEKRVIRSAADIILEDPLRAQSSMVFLMGESGMGKTALALAVMDDIRKSVASKSKKIVTARSTSTETEQRIPLSSYRKIFLSVVHDLCEQEEKLSHNAEELNASMASLDLRSKSMHGFSALRRQSSRTSATLSLRTRTTGDDGSLRPVLPYTKGASARELAEEDSTLESSRASLMNPLNLDAEEPNGLQEGAEHVDSFSQSLRDISADLASAPSPQRKEQSRDKLPQSLNSMSMHGGDVARRRTRNRSNASETASMLPISRATTHGSVLSTRRERTQSGGNLGQSLNALGGKMSGKSRHSAGDDVSMESGDTGKLEGNNVNYFGKLCWVCEQLDYPFEYADIVGSQFLGLEGASSGVTQVDGHVPTMDELVEFLALAFICLADFADMIVLFIDDFQWVDSFSWKIFRVLCKRGKKMLMLCAMRSHDKQALRRLSTAANRQGEIQNQMIEISMVPLDFAEIQLLMASVLGFPKKTIPESLCTDVFQRTGGLPVYVVQMLETMKRKKTVEIGEDGLLRWTAAGRKDQRAASSNQSGAVMEETFLSRFDGLDVRVRKVLQSCAVLGLSFALSDVIQVHPEMEETDIENALDTAVDELILVEQIEDEDGDEESVSNRSETTKSESSLTQAQTVDRSRGSGSDALKTLADRFFQFSHAMWRKNVLTTMLQERKIELHRMIAESMEKNQVVILEDSDISRLLTLFEHWKSCGDFIKSAPLALTVGARLEEWDLCAQSLELYEDALEMSYDCVNVTDSAETEWVQVSSKPSVLDLILRLHVHVGLCYKKLGDDRESIITFEDAYKIMRTASKVPSSSKSLMIPIISSLCVLQMAQPALDNRTKSKQEKLLEKFVTEAMNSRSTVHVGRALCMQAVFHSRHGDLEKACSVIDRLRNVYSVEKYSSSMTEEYGRDYAIETLAESVQWYYLLEDHERADEQADTVIEIYLPLVDPLDVDACMNVILPIVQVFRLTSRADDAEWLLKRYVINPSHDHASNSQFWVPLFNPLAYVIELILMEESEEFDEDAILEMESWVLEQSDVDYAEELEKKAFCLIGEICWRLANYRDEGDEIRDQLEQKAKDLLRPVARYPHHEFFLRKTALALMDAF